jgi:hypothetical protein
MLNTFSTTNFHKYWRFSKICYQAQWKVNILDEHKRGMQAGKAGMAAKSCGLQI